MSDVHPDLLLFADAVEFHSDSSYSILGNASVELTARVDGESPGLALVRTLAGDLYQKVYVRAVDRRPARVLAWEEQRRFLAVLSRANSGTGTWEPGWTVRRLEHDGTAAVGQAPMNLWVPAAEVRTPPGVPLAVGASCAVRVPAELRCLVQGYYTALGDAAETDGSAPFRSRGPGCRFYWNLSTEAAVTFVAETTRRLNAAGVPFRLKVFNNPTAYTRADAGVLYLAKAAARQARKALGEIVAAVSAGLYAEVPRLTLRLADGLAMADDPPASVSFGEHRCGLIAQALWSAFQRGETGTEARLSAIAADFRAAGLDPCHPYLEPGSRIDDLQACVPPLRVSARRPRARAGRPGPAITPLDAALGIGRVLCQTAYWDRDERYCSWMGRSTAEADSPRQVTPTSAALGPDLYSGTAGIALFLAQLQAEAESPDLRRTAIAAMARSLWLARQGSTTLSPLSVFCGLPGIAHTALEVARLTSEPQLAQEALVLLERVPEALGRPQPMDLMGGHAGVIPVLLALNGTCGALRTVDLAVALGEELRRAAIAPDDGTARAWDPDAASGPRMASSPLTGLSHGASGMALALLELYAATGRDDFLEIARGAFDYENMLFDQERGNWPDLRLGLNDPQSGPRSSFACAWCHGAPGIALARMRASILDPDPAQAGVHRAMLRAALATTRKVMDDLLERPGADASLCHGLAGLMEITAMAGRHLNDPACLQCAERAADTLIRRHAAAADYPSGMLSGGPNPSLMLGLAGVGHAFLRRHAADRVAPVLLLGPATRPR